MNTQLPSEGASASARPVPAPPKHPLTQPIPVVKGAKRVEPATRRKRARRRRRPKLPDRAIVFVGPMAAGKTSLGRHVAKALGVPFIDTDAVFVRHHGVIATFFDAHGEAEFRRLEEAVIEAELAKPGARIVALGGGAVLSERTRELLARHPVVLLMTTQEAVLRTANIAKRPLLRDDPDAWNRILHARRPFYEQVADVTYRTDRASKEQLSRRVVGWVRSRAAAAAGDGFAPQLNSTAGQGVSPEQQPPDPDETPTPAQGATQHE